MKKIGLIGGITWQSTQLYYQYINEFVQERLGGNHSAKLVLESVDFSEISSKQKNNDWPGLDNDMAQIGQRLENAGADIILIGANTMHLCAPAMIEKLRVPLLHIAEATGKSVQNAGLKKVLLLGTKYTMELDFYKNVLKEKFGIETIIPNTDDREVVHSVIYDEIAKGELKSGSKKAYQDIIKKGIAQGAEGVILGCTEIPLLIKPEDCTVPSFDTTKIHSAAAVDFSLS
jgi:aspartate racemase